MEILHWISAHHDLFQDLAIVASLGITAITVRREEKSRHTANHLAVNAAYREIWSPLLDHPELARIRESDVALSRKPVTAEEFQVVIFVIHHLYACFRGSMVGMYVTVGALKADVRKFFSLPIPKAVWDNVKHLQDKELVDFIENCLK